EDDGDLFAADRIQLSAAQRHKVAPLPKDLAIHDASGRHGNQLQHGERGDGLAATGFTHHSQRLAAIDDEVYAVHRLHHAVIGSKVRLKPTDFEQGATHHMTLRGSSVSRSPSPMKLMESTVRKMAAPGKRAQCGAMSR